MSYFPEQLTTFEYYKKLLPMYLRQSYGYPEHFRIMQTVLKNIVDVGDDILNGLNIFGENYLEYIDSLGSNTDNDTLDKLGKIWGIPRVLSIESGSSQTVSSSGTMKIVTPNAQQTVVNLGWEPTTFTFDYDMTTDSFIGLELPTIIDSNPVHIQVNTNVVPSNWKVITQIYDGAYVYAIPLTYANSKFSYDYGVYHVEINNISYDSQSGLYNADFMATKSGAALTRTHQVVVYRQGTVTHTSVPVSGSWSGQANSYINITASGFNYKLAGTEWQNSSCNTNSGPITGSSVNLGYRPDVAILEWDQYYIPTEDDQMDEGWYHYRLTCFDRLDSTNYSQYFSDPDDYFEITNTGLAWRFDGTGWADPISFGEIINMTYLAGKVNGSSGTMLNPSYTCSATLGGSVPITMTLDNKLYLMLIKACVGRAFYDGSREQAIEVYKRMGMKVGFVQSDLTKQEVDVYLQLTAQELADEPNIQLLFEAGLLTIESMGIKYNYHVVTYG